MSFYQVRIELRHNHQAMSFNYSTNCSRASVLQAEFHGSDDLKRKMHCYSGRVVLVLEMTNWWMLEAV